MTMPKVSVRLGNYKHICGSHMFGQGSPDRKPTKTVSGNFGFKFFQLRTIPHHNFCSWNIQGQKGVNALFDGYSSNKTWI